MVKALTLFNLPLEENFDNGRREFTTMMASSSDEEEEPPLTNKRRRMVESHSEGRESTSLSARDLVLELNGSELFTYGMDTGEEASIEAPAMPDPFNLTTDMNLAAHLDEIREQSQLIQQELRLFEELQHSSSSLLGGGGGGATDATLVTPVRGNALSLLPPVGLLVSPSSLLGEGGGGGTDATLATPAVNDSALSLLPTVPTTAGTYQDSSLLPSFPSAVATSSVFPTPLPMDTSSLFTQHLLMAERGNVRPQLTPSEPNQLEVSILEREVALGNSVAAQQLPRYKNGSANGLIAGEAAKDATSTSY